MPVKKTIVGVKKEKAKEVKEEVIKPSHVSPSTSPEPIVVHKVDVEEVEKEVKVPEKEIPEALLEEDDVEEDTMEEEAQEEISEESYEEISERVLDTQQKTGGDRMPLNVPYMTPNPLVSIIEAVRGANEGRNQLSLKEVVISLDNRLRDKDIMTAIALKHYFLSNKVPCSIHADPDEVGFRSRIVDADKEVTPDLPNPYTYISVLVGVAKNEYLEDRALDKTFLSFGFCGDEDSTKNVAVVTYRESYCSTVPVIYPFVRESVLKYGYKLTKTVATAFYEAIQYSLTYARKIDGIVLKTYHTLLEDGADFRKVEQSINSLPKRSLSFIKLMLNKLTFNNDIAVATIPFSSLGDYQDLPEKKFNNIVRRAVGTFRYLEEVKAWCIYVEQKPGEYLVVLQTKNCLPYDMSNIAKRNNGIGTKNDAICLIYDFDKEKILTNLKDHIKDKDAKQSESK